MDAGFMKSGSLLLPEIVPEDLPDPGRCARKSLWSSWDRYKEVIVIKKTYNRMNTPHPS
jgi:hypothetical protein